MDADPRALAPLRARANAGPHAAGLAALQSIVAQRACADCERVRETMGGPVQRAAASGGAGLPDGLRAGLESLSGRDLSGVRVHYGSPRPAQLAAHAYTQGSEIHVAAGQERHLPHEGWHAVQQMEGRVRPTLQLHGTAINDDAALEREADRMGTRALRAGAVQRAAAGNGAGAAVSARAPVQRVVVIGEGEPITGEKEIYGLALEAGASESEAAMLAAMGSDDLLHSFGSWNEAVRFAKRRLDPNNNNNEIGGKKEEEEKKEEIEVHALGVGEVKDEGRWEIDEFSRVPGPYYVNYTTGETYDPGRRVVGSLFEANERELTPFRQWKMMQRIGRDVDVASDSPFEAEFEAYDELRRGAGVGEEWSGVLEECAAVIMDRVGVDQAMELLPKLIAYLKELTGMLGERAEGFRPVTREYVKQRIEKHATAMAEGGSGAFPIEELGRISDQEMLAQQLIRARKEKDPKRFKKLLGQAEPVVQESGSSLKVEFHLFGIRLGEVTMVQTNPGIVELHFNVDEPLKYIGVASELWNRGLEVLRKVFPKLGKVDVILPAFSSASALMVTRQLAEIGGDAGDYVLGKKAGEARKAGRDVASSASAQHERFVKGGQDETTTEETAHYLRSVAKSVYSRAYGIVGYLNPWKLMEAYGVGPQDVDQEGLALAIQEQAQNPSTLAGHVEVRRAHELLGLKYDPNQFVPAVESGRIKMMLGIRGQSLIDFSFRNTTVDTIKRWSQLKLAN
ncbi:MAG: DUF4157 domain-containing protein [Longimicrobiaceae bacterium]